MNRKSRKYINISHVSVKRARAFICLLRFDTGNDHSKWERLRLNTYAPHNSVVTRAPNEKDFPPKKIGIFTSELNKAFYT